MYNLYNVETKYNLGDEIMGRKLNKRQAHQQEQLGISTDCTALYIRVSTDKQADEGFSIDAQQAKLRAYCTAHDYHVCEDHIYIDAGVSGKTADRPEFKRMMSAAAAGDVNRIVAIKLDRMARNVRQFLGTVDQLSKVGCDLVLVHESFDTSTPHGRFALTMFAAIAELEASQITERVMSGKRQKATDGGYNGAPAPLGYDYEDGIFTVNEAEADTVRRIYSEFLEGGKLAGIARRLNEDQVPTKRGGQWYAGTVRKILLNGFHAGLAQYEDHEADGDHPAIVDIDTYEDAVKRLQRLHPGRPATT